MFASFPFPVQRIRLHHRLTEMSVIPVVKASSVTLSNRGWLVNEYASSLNRLNWQTNPIWLRQSKILDLSFFLAVAVCIFGDRRIQH